MADRDEVRCGRRRPTLEEAIRETLGPVVWALASRRHIDAYLEGPCRKFLDRETHEEAKGG